MSLNESSSRIAISPALIAAAIPAAAAFGVTMAATGRGAGLSIDSVYYVAAARQLAAGEGLTIPWGTPEPTPLGTQLGSLLSILLAAFERLGVDAVVAVPWLNAVFFAATAALLSGIVLRATGDAWLALAVGLFAATSRLMIAVHAMAWSEPAFVFFAWSALALVASFAARHRHRTLAAACALGVLAVLTRYAGAALALTALAALLLGVGRMRTRLIAGACAGMIAFLPMTPGGPTWWEFARQHLAINSRVFAPDSPVMRQLAHVRGLADVITGWAWPDAAAAWLPGPSWRVVIAAAFGALTAALAVRARRSPAFRAASPATDGRASGLAIDTAGAAAAPDDRVYREQLCWVMGLFLMLYPLFLVSAILFFGRTFVFDNRILLPMMGPALLLLVCSFHALMGSCGRRRWVGTAGTICLVAAAAVRVPRACDYGLWFAGTSGLGGQGYHDAGWRESPTLDVVRGMPRNRTIYSNGPDALYILTGRRALWLANAARGCYEANAAAAADAPLDDLRSALKNGAVIVHFDRLAWRRYSPSRAELTSRLPLRVVAETADGIVYGGLPNATADDLVGMSGGLDRPESIPQTGDVRTCHEEDFQTMTSTVILTNGHEH